MAACRGGPPDREGEACVADTTGGLPPIYTFAGEPLNLDRDGRERVDKWVDYFVDRRPDRFALFFRRSGRYEADILEKLRENGLPEDFLYLAFIESGMNPHAYSRSHAVGLWQFLEATGGMYGLEVNALVDERRSPERATQAAINYLSDLHEQFGDWFLAAAAYNGGPGRVGRALQRSGSRDFWDLVRGGYLPQETADYVPKLLAAAWIARAPGLHGFGLVPKDPPPPYDRVRLDGRNRLSVVAAAAGVPEEDVRELNPQLVAGVTPGSGWSDLRLPVGTRDRFEEVYRHIPIHHRAGTTGHTVRRGETLGAIARTYGVSVRGLLSVNPEVHPRRLRVGQEIQVPAEGG